jgi:hypothetical protein
MARRKPTMRRQSKTRKAPEGSALFPVVASNLLNMICVTAASAAVLAVILGVAKWT